MLCGRWNLTCRCVASATHFASRLKVLKKERARFNRTTQVQLQVRSFWKSGFYAEMLGEARKAIKASQKRAEGNVVSIHFGFPSAQAYQRAMDLLLREQVPHTDPARLMEHKVVLEFAVLRMARLMMTRGEIMAACDKVQRLLSDCKGRVGPEALEFQHWGWCAHVHEALAALLQSYGHVAEEPLSSGIDNPGFHYQAAARCTDMRRAVAHRCRQLVHAPLPKLQALPDTPSRLDPARQRYAGQPYDEVAAHPLQLKGPGDSDKPMTMETELAKELNVKHSEIIVSLLHRAYKFFRGPLHRRRQLHIACLLADEHYAAGALELALKFYAEISHSRGVLAWGRLLHHVRARATDCASRLGLREEFVRHSFALLTCSANATRAPETQRAALEALVLLDAPLRVQVADAAIVEVCASWSNVAPALGEPVHLLLELKSLLPLALRVESLRVELASHGDPAHVLHTLSRAEAVELAPHTATPLVLGLADVGAPPDAHVVVASVELAACQGRLLLQASVPHTMMLSVPGRQSAVTLTVVNAPAVWLDNDLTQLVLAVRNNEAHALERGRVEVDVVDLAAKRTTPLPTDSFSLFSDPHSLNAVASVAVPPVAPGATVHVPLWLRASGVSGEHHFVPRLEYGSDQNPVSARTPAPLSATVHKALSARFAFYRELMLPVGARAPTVWLNRPTMVSSMIENVAPVPVELVGVAVQFADTASFRTTSTNAPLGPTLVEVRRR